MAFASLSDFFAMGGYGFYVWLSFGFTYIGLLALGWYSKFEHQALKQQIRAKAAREQRVRKHQETQNDESTS